MVERKTLYFPGLNGIRAIAALIVVIFHIDLVLPSFGLKEIGFHHNNMAGYGVIMFFVLSGYLIKSLLLEEKQLTNNVSIKNFYIRRILRIWPLYYFALIIGIVLYLFGITYSNNFTTALFLYTFFVPNIAFSFKIVIHTITPLWSVGVEEQFYLLWPWLHKNCKNILKVAFTVISIYFLIKIIFWFLKYKSLYDLVVTSAIDCMAIGSIGAYLINSKFTQILNFIYNKWVQILAWFILVYSCIFKPIHLISFIDQELNAIIYLILIINVSTNPKPIISLENKFFDFIGKISYGIYVYHFIILSVFSYHLNGIFKGSVSDYIIVFSSTILSTIIISYLSYVFIEKKFLNLKQKFSVVISKYARHE